MNLIVYFYVGRAQGSVCYMNGIYVSFSNITITSLFFFPVLKHFKNWQVHFDIFEISYCS